MAGETSVERLSWSSAWMARVEGWWVEDEGIGLKLTTALMPLGGTEGAMLQELKETLQKKSKKIKKNPLRIKYCGVRL